MERNSTWLPLRRAIVNRRWHYQRFEDKFSSGIPDLNIHIPGKGDVWIENKYAEVDGAARICIGLRREQYIWLRAAARAGRKCFLLARVGDLWLLWTDDRSWEIAKKPYSWLLMKSRAKKFDGPDQVLEYLVRAI